MASLLTSLVTIALASVSVSAAPTPENVALARKYAPELRFHQNEIYWPSTVEFFLPNVRYKDDSGNVPSQPSPLTGENVDDAADRGANYFLSIDDINGAKGGFLRGQNPSGSDKPVVYTFIAPKSNGVVDLYYWIFTPFNEAKNVPVLGQIGDHIGDWERMTVRTVDGVATQVDYHAHSDTGSGTLPWAQVKKFDNDQRPVGYVAKGSHGFWSSAGTFTYVNAVIFQLKDETSDSGLHWDTRDQLFTINYPETYSGSLDWLNYRGKWGNKGKDDCWWYFIYKGCELIGGPGGPLRDDVLGAANAKNAKAKGIANISGVDDDSVPESFKSAMLGPLSQTLAGISSTGSSEYTVRFAPFTAVNTPFIGVQQLCSSFNATSEETLYDETLATAPLTEVNGAYTINVPACADTFIVASYNVGLCATDATADCTWSSSARNVRAFSDEPGVLGAQEVVAVVVNDIDDWEL